MHVRAECVPLAAHGEARRSFPRRFIERVGDVGYTPPPAEPLAREPSGFLAGTLVPLATEAYTAFDHTIWMGLLHMFPAAIIPVVEMAMPFMPRERLFELGQVLAPLRKADVLIHQQRIVFDARLSFQLMAGFKEEPRKIGAISVARKFSRLTIFSVAHGSLRIQSFRLPQHSANSVTTHA